MTIFKPIKHIKSLKNYYNLLILISFYFALKCSTHLTICCLHVFSSYYYAVVDCDSIATADYLYKACDGIEFERSSNVLDLRFIPDTMEFTHPPRDIATEVCYATL